METIENIDNENGFEFDQKMNGIILTITIPITTIFHITTGQKTNAESDAKY